MVLLSNTMQPPLLTLLNSSSSPPLSPLFHTQINRDLPEDSFICSLDDSSEGSSPLYKPIASSKLLTPNPLAFVPHHASTGTTLHEVIHLQSPTLQDTFIQAGGKNSTYDRKGKGKAVEPLGIELDWLGLQIRRLGAREFAFEVGLVDPKGREGVVRFSTFQRFPRLHLPTKPNSAPMLHIPLTLPPPSSHSTLTPWLQLTINLPSLFSFFHNHSLLPSPPSSDAEDEENTYVNRTIPPVSRKVQYYQRKVLEAGGAKGLLEAPNGTTLGSVSYIRIYANCRVRRVWFSKDGGAWMGGGVKDEWGLYTTEVPS